MMPRVCRCRCPVARLAVLAFGLITFGAVCSPAHAADRKPPPAPPPHPLILSLSKSGYNFYAALKAVVADRSVADACRLIAETEPEDEFGLLPDLTQPDLFLSYPLLVSRYLRGQPEALATMRQQFGALAELRVTAAAEDPCASLMAAAAIQFTGTDGAARACRWLGDRALAAGEFEHARGYYRRLLWAASIPDREQLEQRLALVAALSGRRPNGDAVPEQTFDYSGVQVAAGDFAGLLRELADRGGPQAPVTGGPDAREVAAAPEPGAWRSRWFAGVDVPPARSVELRGLDGEVDAAAWFLACAVTEDQLLLSNRCQLVALARTSGRRLWQQDFESNRLPPIKGDWSPYRPLVAAGRVLVRHAQAKGPPRVSSLELRKGQVQWTSDERLYVASDPWHLGRTVAALTMEVFRPVADASRSAYHNDPWRPDRKTPRDLLLQWTEFAPDTGKFVAQRPLLRCRESADLLPPCRAVATDERLIATLRGATVCLDRVGNVQWVRRQPVPTANYDTAWTWRYPPAPIVAGERVLVCPPGTTTLQGLDLHSGALEWEREIATLRRVLGTASSRVLVQLDDALCGLDAGTGEEAWRRPTRHPWEAFACGDPHGLVYADEENLEPEGPHPAWIWLDARDGRVTARWPIDATLSENRKGRPHLGPLLCTGERILVGYHRKGATGKDREIYELLPANPPSP